MMTKRRLVIAVGVLVLLGGYVFRTYPRHVAVTLWGNISGGLNGTKLAGTIYWDGRS